MSTEQEKIEDQLDEETLETAEDAKAENATDENENENEELNIIEEQQSKILSLENEIEQIRENHLRKAAEMENMKKRLQRERQQFFQVAKENAVKDFLPVSDDLMRTLQAMKDGGAHDAYIDGIELVATKFDEVLTKHDVERIDETGVPFDVDLHDAMMRQKADDDSVESGTVLQVIENGYKMGDKTLRHAKVIVSE
jgi:molecular chaperone GrpE